MDFRIAVAILPWTLALLVLPTIARSQGGETRYISDETAITLREDKGMSAPVSALLKSGTKVELIEEDAASGYSRVRVQPGREGWVLGRYLSTEPAARTRLVAVQAQLTEQTAKVRELEAANARLRETAASTGVSARGVGGDGQAEDVVAVGKRSSESAVMITGAGLFVSGLLAGLLIPMLRGGKARKGWSADL